MSKIEKMHKVVKKFTELDVEMLRIYDDLDEMECKIIMAKLGQFEEYWYKMLFDKYKISLNKTYEYNKRVEELLNDK